MDRYGYDEGENSVGGSGCGRTQLSPEEVVRIGLAIGGHSDSWVHLLRSITEPVYSRQRIDDLYSQYLLSKCNYLTQRGRGNVASAQAYGRPSHNPYQPSTSRAYQAETPSGSNIDCEPPPADGECEEDWSTTSNSSSPTSSSTSSTSSTSPTTTSSAQPPEEDYLAASQRMQETLRQELAELAELDRLDALNTMEEISDEMYSDEYSEEEVHEEQSLIFEEDENEVAGPRNKNEIVCKQLLGGYVDSEDEEEIEEEEDTGPIPLDVHEIIDIVLEIDPEAVEFQEMMVNTELPVYSEEQILRIYEEYMQTFKSPAEIYKLAKEIGGNDKEWLNMVEVLHGTLDCRSDLVELYEGYKVKLEQEGGDGRQDFKLPSEEDPFLNCMKPEQLGYLIKKQK